MRTRPKRLTATSVTLVVFAAAACSGRLGAPPTPSAAAPSRRPEGGEPAQGLKDSLVESHEKSADTATEAAGAVKEGATTAAEGAKEAVEHPREAANEAAQATAEQTKEAAKGFGHDMHHFPERVWRDVEEIPSWRSAIALGAGAGLAAMSNAWWDEDVRRSVRKDPERFGHAENNSLNVAADPVVVFAASSAVYGGSLFLDSPRVHDFSLDMMSALTIEMPAIFVLKKAFHTTRPNGDADGFPSGHTAAATTLAALLGDHFGLYPALAGYAFAGFVAFHRIDYGKHDLSDVIFGSAMGYAVGHAVGDADEELPLVQAHLMPFSGGPRTAQGFALEWRF